MTHDRAFLIACHDLDFCIKIRQSRDTSRYPLADAAYRRAVELRDTYFSNPEPTKNQNQKQP